jgi:hypothetical protein
MKYLLVLLVLLQTVLLVAQQPASASQSGEGVSKSSGDSAANLPEIFNKGRYYGSFRSFFMATDNARHLTDYSALAAGGALYFNTAKFHGFQMGLGGSFHFNLASSGLTTKDPSTGAVNRYEIGLFDVENPVNKNNLNRMEELWLRYEKKQIRMTIGRQLLQSPFVNDQDGRMRPTAISGAWIDVKLLKNTKLEGGWIWGISPRSTVRWYQVGESIGLYPKGLNPDGTASGYPEHIESKGIAMLGVSQNAGKYIKIQVWNQLVENVFNTAFAKADFIRPLRNGHQLILGLQAAHQNALGNGGSENPSQTYFDQHQHANVISGQVGWKYGAWQALTGYTRVTGEGRFLSPREWGREPFYTFMSRERIEGSGDVDAFTGRIIWQQPGKSLRIETGYGHFYLPDVKNFALNKYAFPAFKQFNVDVRYAFSGRLSGARIHFLYVWKGSIGDVYGNDKYVINRVNMSGYNVILNYIF